MGSAAVASVRRISRRFSGAEVGWPPATRVAARIEGQLTMVLASTFEVNVAMADDRALRAAALSADVEALYTALRLPQGDKRVASVVEPYLGAAFLSGAELGADTLQGFGVTVERSILINTKDPFTVRLDSVNPLAVKWAQKRSATLVVAPSKVKQAIRRLVVLSQQGRFTPQQLARQIRDIIGLDERRLAAVARFAERLSDQGISPGDIDRRVERYANAQRRARALVIARTETIAAVNAGQQALWSEAVKVGALRAEVMVKVWITTPDELLCAVCEALDGETTDIDDVFTSGDEGPPAHPNCRCATGLVPRKESPR